MNKRKADKKLEIKSDCEIGMMEEGKNGKGYTDDHFHTKLVSISAEFKMKI